MDGTVRAMPLLRSSTGALFKGVDDPQADSAATARQHKVQGIKRLAEVSLLSMVMDFAEPGNGQPGRKVGVF